MINFSNNNQQRLYRDLILKQNISSIMSIPRISKVVLNSSTNSYIVDRKNILAAFVGLEYITGQKPKYSQAKKSIAGFKLREDQALGCHVTLRNVKMYNFIMKYINITAPSTRELSKKLINHNNIDLVVKNFNSFVELQKFYEYFHSLKGIEIHFTVKMTKSKMSLIEREKQVLLIYSAYRLPVTKKN